MLIQIARLLRVTLFEKELQTLRPGEFYDVPPAVGRVLVSEGWAVQPHASTVDGSGEPVTCANDDPSEPRSS